MRLRFLPASRINWLFFCPFQTVIKLTAKKSAISGKSSISGYPPSPFHLEIACGVTHIAAARSSCVTFCSFLKFLIIVPILTFIDVSPFKIFSVSLRLYYIIQEKKVNYQLVVNDINERFIYTIPHWIYSIFLINLLNFTKAC